MFGADSTLPLCAAAIAKALRPALASGPHGALPLLATATSFTAGGHAGSENFCDIAAGPVRRRDVARMLPFNHPACAVVRTGRQLRDWLVFASGFFHQLTTGAEGPLVDPAFPSYHFDWIFGLTYRFDLGAPPGVAGRVTDLCHNGEPVRDDDRFIVATSSFRARGGGGQPPFPDHDIIATTDVGMRDALAAYLQADGTALPFSANVWHLSAPPGAVGWAATSATARMDEAPPGVFRTNRGDDGFAIVAKRF